MNKSRLCILIGILSVVMLALPARTFAQAESTESVHLPAGSTIPVMLEKAVDARKNKVGDEILARITENVKSDGRVVIPKGSKIVGHVTVTEGRVKTKEESESVIGISFDHAVLKDGRQIPLSLEVQAVAPAAAERVDASEMSPSSSSSSGGGGSPSMPGQGSNQGSMANPNAGTPGRIASPENAAGASSQTLTASGGLTPSCHGVLGIDGLGLNPESSDATQGSLIVSQSRNVHLDGRTQMMLRVKGI